MLTGKTKRGISALLVLFLIVNLLAIGTIPAFAEGEEPQLSDGYYQLASADDLMWFAAKVNDGGTELKAKLTGDIDMTGKAWTPMGASSAFTGEFDGCGHTISHLGTAEEYTSNGLFNLCSGTIKNLIIADSYIGVGGARTGGIVGSGMAVVVNCGITGTTIKGGAMSGGIVGQGGATIVNCWSDVEITGMGAYGGICGMVFGTTTNTFYYNTNGTQAYTNAGTRTNVFEVSETADHDNGKYTAAEFADGTVLALLNGYNNTTGKALHLWKQSEGSAHPVLDYTALIPVIPQQDEDGYYQLASADDLMWFAAKVNDGGTELKAKLTGDIDMTGKTWTPMGASSAFTGEFDGCGHTISHLGTAEEYTSNGLFNLCSGTIKNLIIADSYIGVGSARTGGFAGSGMAVVVNCGITGTTIKGGAMSGGIVGQGGATIVNCWSDVEITGMGAYGGICGMVFGTTTNTFYYNTNGTQAYTNAGTRTNVFEVSETADHDNGKYTSAEFADGTVLALLNGYSSPDYDIYGWKQDGEHPVLDWSSLKPKPTYEVQYKAGTEVTIGDFVYKVLTADTETSNATFELVKYTGAGGALDIANGEKYDVVSIAAYVFLGNTAITEVKLPATLTSIGVQAFNRCTALTKVNIPAGLKTIGHHAFADCSALKNITLEDGLTVLGSDMFTNCAVEELVIPASIKDWGDSTFMRATSLTKLTLKEGLTSVGDSAFFWCTALESVELPASLTELGDSSFNGTGLKSITLPAGLKSIGSNALSCRGITEVTLPDGLETLGNSVFGSAYLTELNIPASVTSIAGYLCNYKYFTQYTVDGNNAKYTAIDGVLFEKNASGDPVTLIAYPAGAEREEYVIPGTVTMIKSYAFMYAYNLKKVTIPASVKAWDEYAFYDCRALEEAVLEDGLTVLGKHALYMCSKMTGITVPDSVTEIGDGALGYSHSGAAANFTIKGYTGSQAHIYANANGFTFISIGSSSSDTPVEEDGYYILKSPQDVLWFAAQVNESSNRGLKAKLANDIDLSGVCGEGNDWTPIGSYSSLSTANGFQGEFDGCGHTLSGLYIGEGKAYSGLFGALNGATVKNLTVSGKIVCSEGYTGGIAGYVVNESVISGCVNNVELDCSGAFNQYVGGIAGYVSNSQVSGCANKADVSGFYYLGGIVGGTGFNVDITRCYNTGSVNGKNSFVGGIAGMLGGQNAASMSYCYNLGEITGSGYTGGLAGSAGTGGTIANVYNTGKVDSTGGAGVAGAGDVSKITNAYYSMGSSPRGITGDDPGTIQAVRAAQVKGGELAYLLNTGDASGEYHWTQDGSLNTPVLKDAAALPYKAAMYYQQTGTGPQFYVNVYADADGHILLLNPRVDSFDVEGYYLMDGENVTDTVVTADYVLTGDISVCAVLAYSEGKTYEDEDKYEGTVTVDKYADYETDVVSYDAWTDHYGEWVVQSDGDAIDTMVLYAKLRFDRAVKLADGKTIEDLMNEVSVSVGSWGNEGSKDYELTISEDGKEISIKAYIGYAIYGGHLVVWPKNEKAGLTTLVFSDNGDAVKINTDLVVPNGLYTESTSVTVGTATTPASTTVKLCALNEENNHTTRAMIHMAILSNGESALDGGLDIYGGNLTGHWHKYDSLTPEGYWKLNYVNNSNLKGKYTVTFNGDEMTITAVEAVEGEVIEFHVVSYLNNGSVQLDKTELNKALEAAEKVEYSESFDEADYNSFLKALALAKAAKDSKYYSQKDIDEKADALKAAYDALGITEEEKNFTLSFETNGGSEIQAVEKPENTVIDLADYVTKKAGYTFEGWYADEALTEKVESVKLTQNTTVYAKWTANSIPVIPTEPDEPEPDKPWNNPFGDISKDKWYYDDVRYVYENGLMVGTASGVFSPELNTTRAMIVTILYRMEGSPAVSGSNAFTDVTPGSYCDKAVAWAAANGIVKGIGDNKFAPNSYVTREQLAAILYRYAAYKGYDTTKSSGLGSFSDSASVSGWAVEAMSWAVGESLISGTDGGKLLPAGYATRSQTAAIFHRFCENIAK